MKDDEAMTVILAVCEQTFSERDGFRMSMRDDARERVTALLAKVRTDTRRDVGRAISTEANRIYGKQRQQDYPSNVLDRVALHLTSGMPLEVRPERLHRCGRQQIKCSGCLDCQPDADNAGDGTKGEK